MSEDHTPDIKGDTVSPIIEVLKKKDSPASVRITAIKALGAMGAQAQQAIPVLEQASNDENPAIRESAVEALKKISQGEFITHPSQNYDEGKKRKLNESDSGMHITRGYEPVKRLDTNVMASRKALAEMNFPKSEIDKVDAGLRARNKVLNSARKANRIVQNMLKGEEVQSILPEPIFCDICGESTGIGIAELTSPEQCAKIPSGWILVKFGRDSAYAVIPPGVVIDYSRGKIYIVCGTCQLVLGLLPTESGLLIHEIKGGLGNHWGYVDLDRIERLMQSKDSSANYLGQLNTTPVNTTSESTYEDIKRLFSTDDLSRYNLLCKEYVNLRNNIKNNIELWDMVQYPSKLRTVLDEIHTLRDKYDLLKYGAFLKVWRFNPNSNKYEEMCW